MCDLANSFNHQLVGSLSKRIVQIYLSMSKELQYSLTRFSTIHRSSTLEKKGVSLPAHQMIRGVSDARHTVHSTQYTVRPASRFRLIQQTRLSGDFHSSNIHSYTKMLGLIRRHLSALLRLRSTALRSLGGVFSPPASALFLSSLSFLASPSAHIDKTRPAMWSAASRY
jgi:hypothetical protein